MIKKNPAKNKMFGRKKKAKAVAVEPPIVEDDELEELEEPEEEEELTGEEEEMHVKKNSVVKKKQVDILDGEITEEIAREYLKKINILENVLRVHDETLKRILYHLRI